MGDELIVLKKLEKKLKKKHELIYKIEVIQISSKDGLQVEMGMCAECVESIALFHCVQCADLYCRDCFQDSTLKGSIVDWHYDKSQIK